MWLVGFVVLAFLVLGFLSSKLGEFILIQSLRLIFGTLFGLVFFLAVLIYKLAQ